MENQDKDFFKFAEINRGLNINPLEEASIPFIHGRNQPRMIPFGKIPPRPDEMTASPILTSSVLGNIFQPATGRTVALQNTMGTAPLKEGCNIAVLIDDQHDPGDVPGTFRNPADNPLIVQDRKSHHSIPAPFLY